MMQRRSVGFVIVARKRPLDLCLDVIGVDSQCAIQNRRCLRVASEKIVIDRPLSERLEVARAKHSRALPVPSGLFPASPPPLDKARQLEYPRVIRQALLSNFQLGKRVIIIKVSAEKILCTRKVRFACFRTEARGCLNSCFSHGKTSRSMLVASVKAVV